MKRTHLFHLSDQKPHNQSPGGFRIKAYSENFPILKGMSLYKLLLEPSSAREPHWHPNADEFGYCLEGEVLVSFYHTNNLKQTFLVQAGDAFFIPSGAFHCIMNVGKKSAELLLQFSHENAEEFNLPSTMGIFSNAVLGNTWGVNSKLFETLHRPLKDQFAVLLKEQVQVPSEAHQTSLYHYPLEKSEPILDTLSGSVRMAKQNVWPILQRQALYSLHLTGQGMREPHWHPETAELGYVRSGIGRMTILNPNGAKETYTLKPGDVYFIPKAYPHHIENLENTPLHFLIFFDQPMPSDIGFTSSIPSLPNEVLADVLQTKPSFFNQLHKYYTDQFIVEKINPVDP
jgi:oxalate decarboxylase